MYNYYEIHTDIEEIKDWSIYEIIGGSTLSDQQPNGPREEKLTLRSALSIMVDCRSQGRLVYSFVLTSG